MSSHQQMLRKPACHRPYHRRPSRLQRRLPPSERSPQPRRECSRRPQQVRNRPSQLRHGEPPARLSAPERSTAATLWRGRGWQPGSGCHVHKRAVATMGALQDSRSPTPRTVHGGASASIEGGSPAAVAGSWDVHTPCHQHRRAFRAQHRLHGHTAPQKLESRCERTPIERRRRRVTTRAKTRCDCTLARIRDLRAGARCVRRRRLRTL